MLQHCPCDFSARDDAHDRCLLLDHAQRPQGHDVSRGDRPAVQDHAGEYRQGRTVQVAISGRLPQQPNSRHPRSRTGRRRRADCSFESGAILLYLAEKTGRFLAKDLRARVDAIQWLFWQMGNLGPMAGQNNHFSNYAVEKIPYAMDRYRNEVNRLYGVLNKRLADRSFVAGEYSIADMAIYPWIVPYERQGQNIADFPHLKRWFETIRARPAVDRAYEKAKAVNPNVGGIRTAEERAILFGQTAASVERAAAQAR